MIQMNKYNTINKVLIGRLFAWDLNVLDASSKKSVCALHHRFFNSYLLLKFRTILGWQNSAYFRIYFLNIAYNHNFTEDY